jgi:hypothetical protein
MKLLSPAATNAKTAKNELDGRYFSAILHLAPSSLSGYDVCPAASNGCKMSCLNTAGRGRFNNVQTARLNKTLRFFKDRNGFLADLIDDIGYMVDKADKLGKIPVVRLNGTSDIDWENIKIDGFMNIFEYWPQVQFYDYTKRIARLNRTKLPDNYHLTFSLSEVNKVAAKRVLSLGFNVAAVFHTIPNQYESIEVINGDNTDLRFLEGYQGKIVGLKAKGKAKKDTSGFVIA